MEVGMSIVCKERERFPRRGLGTGKLSAELRDTCAS